MRFVNKDILVKISFLEFVQKIFMMNHLFLESSPETKINAHIEVAELMGAEIVLYSKVNDQDFVARVDARFNVMLVETIDLAFNLSKAHFFDNETEERIK